jgi:uncharacterized membrane protein YphA (DoxX/SURF4 family)
MTTLHTGPAMPLDSLSDVVPLDPLTVLPEAPAEQSVAEQSTNDAVVDVPPGPGVRAGAASWFLRAGLAFVFGYAAVSSLVDPLAAATYFPAQLPADLVVDVLVPAFAGYEIVLALTLLSGRFTYAAAVLAAVTLGGIVVANADAFSVLFRNVAIACAALALAAESRDAHRRRSGASPEAPAEEADAAG